MALLAECFEALGGVPKVVLADRMGCLKGGVVANLVVPTPDYIRFATHYGFRPDFCHANDPESKGIVENLVGYAKRDLMVPTGVSTGDLAGANEQAASLVRRGQRRSALGDHGGSGAAARAGTAAAEEAAVVAVRGHRGQAGQPQGRQAVVRAVRVGPLLGPEPAHRRHGDLDRRRRAGA